jgi:hypothetical protein
MKTYVAFSGGKDSTALALLLSDAIPVFTDTKWEHDPLYEHIGRFEQVTGRKVERISAGSLPEYIEEHKYLPNFQTRFCTRIFKIEAMNEWLADKLPCKLAIGLRADEPPEARVGNLSDIAGLEIIYPLREQNIDLMGVIEICLKHNLLPRYPAYMAGGGCIGCFFKTKGQILSFVHQAPQEEVATLQHLEESIQDKRKNGFNVFANIGMSIRDIKKQPLLLSAEEVFAEAAKAKTCGVFCHK